MFLLHISFNVLWQYRIKLYSLDFYEEYIKNNMYIYADIVVVMDINYNYYNLL